MVDIMDSPQGDQVERDAAATVTTRATAVMQRVIGLLFRGIAGNGMCREGDHGGSDRDHGRRHYAADPRNGTSKAKMPPSWATTVSYTHLTLPTKRIV